MTTIDGVDWTLEGMNNPLTLQHTLLKRFEEETGTAIVDTNNTACVLMEGFATMAASQMKMMDDTVRPALYPARAVSAADLLKHISDYDYVDIFSTPCEAKICLIIEKNFVITHAVPVPDPDHPGQFKSYNKLEIPRSTQIHLGEHTFGLYYPIEIRTNLKSGQFSVLYNMRDVNGVRTLNPLKTLETNVLPFEFREFNGHKLVYIQVPVYQFKASGYDFSLIPSTGFKQKIEYQDKFYALRCWADVLQNYGHDETEEDVYKRVELNLAVSGQTYDPTTPTVIFTPDEVENEVQLEVPYVYFMEKRIIGTLHVDIMTTEGYVDYRVPYNTEETCVIDIFNNVTKEDDEQYNATTYAEPFRQMPRGLQAFPLQSHVVGGSNGIDFEALRNKIIRGANTNVLQTPADIDEYFAAHGYTATLYRDGITDRIFIAHATVKDEDGVVVGADCMKTLFDFSKINDYSTIIKAPYSRSTYTVLPSTIYKFNKDKRIAIPLTDIERAKLNAMSPSERVEMFNSDIHTLSPFHLFINASNKYPTTITYDMTQVQRVARVFVDARDSSWGLSLNTVNLDVYPRAGDPADRYRLSFRVSRVGFGSEVPVRETYADSQGEKKIRVLVGLKNDDGEYRWAEAQYIGFENGDEENATNEIFECIITPNYIFHQANNEHTVQMAFWDNDTFTDYFLKSECRVILLMKGDLLPSDTDITQRSLKNGTSISSGSLILPTSKMVPLNSELGMNGYVAMLEHKCVFQFGSPVDELDQRINLTYSEAVYQTHRTTKFRTLEDDVYERDDEGKLVIETDDQGIPHAVKKFTKGTLACLTKTISETIEPNDLNRSNYEQYIKDPADLSKDSVAADVPMIPKFSITNKSGIGAGKYELVDATNPETLPVSSMYNLWVRGGKEKDTGNVYLIKTVNALRAILGMCTSFESGADSSDPLNDAYNAGTKFKPGTFVIITNDSSTPEAIQLDTLGPEPSLPTYTRLYYKLRDRTKVEITSGISESKVFLCISQGQTLQSMNDAIESEETPADGVDAKYYGFAYVLGKYDSTGTVAIGDTPNYISFLSTTDYTSTMETFSETQDEVAIATKLYYKFYNDEYVLCGDNDFDAEGGFLPSETYFEKNTDTTTYQIPDFSKFELAAWERKGDRVRYDEAAFEFDSDNRSKYRYCYKDKEAWKYGINRWIDFTPSPTDTVADYTVLSADRAVYYYQDYPEYLTTGENFGWESHGNRWPWEMDNWKIISSYETNGTLVHYLTNDESLEFDSMYDRIKRYCEFSSSQVILDEDGHPLEDYTKDRYLQYTVDMLQLDAKLAQVGVNKEDLRVGSDFTDDGPNANKYPSTVVRVLRTHFDAIGNARDSMFTNTRLFFEPVRSLGYANFSIGNGVIKELPLDVSIKFRLHVTKSVYEDDILLLQLRKQIISLIDEHIDRGGYLNCVDIAKQIVADMSGSIKYVDVLGIDGDPDLQTMKSEDKDVRPHLCHKLVLQSDGITIDVERGLEIEAVINE